MAAEYQDLLLEGLDMKRGRFRVLLEMIVPNLTYKKNKHSQNMHLATNKIEKMQHFLMFFTLKLNLHVMVGITIMRLSVLVS